MSNMKTVEPTAGPVPYPVKRFPAVKPMQMLDGPAEVDVSDPYWARRLREIKNKSGHIIQRAEIRIVNKPKKKKEK